MKRWIANFVMGLVMVAGAAFSAYNNFALFQSIFGDDIQGVMSSAAGLALFDLGALGWLLHFAYSARGNAQRAIAATCGLLCLVLTLIAAGTHIILSQSLIAVPAWAGLVAMVAILVGLTINILGIAGNHMAQPDVLTAMREQAQNDEREEAIRGAQGQVFREALRQSVARIGQTAASVAEQLSQEFAQDANREMLSMTSGGDSTAAPRLPAPHSKPAYQYAAETEPAPVMAQRPPAAHSNGTAPGK